VNILIKLSQLVRRLTFAFYRSIQVDAK